MLSGLLYFHRISDNRVAGTPLRNFHVFKELCGRDNFRNVALVTTMWDEVSEDEGQRHEEELKTDFWQSMIKRGSTTHRFHLTRESAWDIINTISVLPPDERRPLQIQREMVDENKPVHKTSAAKAVLRSIGDFFSGVRGLFRRSKESRNVKKDSQIQTSLSVRRYHIPSFPSSTSISSYDSLGSVFLTNRESVCTDNTPMTSLAGTLSEHSYRTAVGGVVTNLKLAQSVAELVRIRCLKEVVVPSLNIAQAIEVFAPTEMMTSMNPRGRP